jgi:hypothetical protein
MAGLVPAITATNTFLIEVDATNPALRTLGSTALNGKKSPGEPGLKVASVFFPAELTSSSGRSASSGLP